MKSNTWNNIKEYLNIFWTMFIIGLTTYGGGYAMVSILERELGEKRKWIETEELVDYIAISQITPGIIAINVATFVGRKKKGFKGAVASTLGVVTPSLIIIIIIAAVLVNFADNIYVQHAFAGIRIVVCALIISAVIKFFKTTVVDWLTFVVFVCTFAVAVFSKLETVYIVLCVIALSVILALINERKKITGLKLKGFKTEEASDEENSQEKKTENSESGEFIMSEKEDKTC